MVVFLQINLSPNKKNSPNDLARCFLGFLEENLEIESQ
jgi:hypothetical protein